MSNQRYAQLEEENKRLRDALQEIAGYTMSQFGNASHMAEQCVYRACQAVYGGEPK